MGSNQHSVTPNAQKFKSFRHRLGWTQDETATKAGYSVRLIRKIEKQQPVRPQTLRDVIQCYSAAFQDQSYPFEDFVLPVAESDSSPAITSEECPLVRKLTEYYDDVYQKRQLDRVGDFACPEIRFTSEGELRIGIAAIQQRAAIILKAFDPIEFVIDRTLSKDQIVVVSWSVRMKHIGEFVGIPATEKWVDVRGNAIVVFAEGIAVEAEDQFDMDSLIRQLTGKKRLTI